MSFGRWIAFRSAHFIFGFDDEAHNGEAKKKCKATDQCLRWSIFLTRTVCRCIVIMQSNRISFSVRKGSGFRFKTITKTIDSINKNTIRGNERLNVDWTCCHVFGRFDEALGICDWLMRIEHGIFRDCFRKESLQWHSNSFATLLLLRIREYTTNITLRRRWFESSALNDVIHQCIQCIDKGKTICIQQPSVIGEKIKSNLWYALLTHATLGLCSTGT